jgi:hypothetical protein
MNDFEDQLRDNSVRQIPPAWRQEILAAARQELAQKEESRCIGTAEPSGIRRISNSAPPVKPWWISWLWPSPVAWAAVACAWLLIFGLDFASRPSHEETAALAAIPPEAIEKALIQQRQIVQELFRSGIEPAVPPRRRESSPGACNGYATQTRSETA